MNILTPANFAKKLGILKRLQKTLPLLTIFLQGPILLNPGNYSNSSKTKARFGHLFTSLIHLNHIAGFVQELVVETDELGIAKTRLKKKNMQTKKRHTNMQRSQYHFNKAITKTPKYRDYFNPSLQVENNLLGIAEMVSKFQRKNSIII